VTTFYEISALRAERGQRNYDIEQKIMEIEEDLTPKGLFTAPMFM
jgi:hypothetical protein